MYNFTQHYCTKDQIEAGVIEVENKQLVQNLLTFNEIPTEQDLMDRAKQLTSYALSINAKEVMIGGAMYFMPYLIYELNKVGIKAYYAFSKRESIDVKQEDGSVKKEILFKHEGFILATLPGENL